MATTGPAFMEALRSRPDLHIVRSKADAHPGTHGAYLNAASLFTVVTDRGEINDRLSEGGPVGKWVGSGGQVVNGLYWRR